MLAPIYQKRFEKDIKKAKKRGNKIPKLKSIILKLLTEEPIPAKNRNHKLKGELEGFCDYHKALSFEKYLKTGSGRELAKKRFW